MNLEIYVCENYAADYEAAIKSENFTDVSVVKYSCFCINRKLTNNFLESFFGENKPETDKLILCGDNCDILKHDDICSAAYQVITTAYCFNYLANNKLIDYILEKGG